jgi:filamentous hemagglutinin family protein
MLKLPFRKASITAILLSLLKSISVQGQIVPDGTVNSRVTPQGNTIQIDGGTTRGSNLFHSFQNFSVPTGSTAFFNNEASIQNIISRVTGTSVSSIDGTLKANGTANLFFLNPNGIIFGKNARLDIGGSFLGTTANSIKFADGIEFSAIAPQSSPLLTVKLPVGLVFGSNPGEINITDSGHQLVTEISSPISRAGTPPGLQVLPGNNLALLGGDLFLNGGILSAPRGQIELGSVKQGQVVVDTTTNQWSFNYQPQSTLGRIELTNRSFLDTTGTGGASLGIYGRQIFLKEDSAVIMQTLGEIPDKELKLTASELIDIRSANLPETIPTGLYSVSTNSGSGAQITLLSPSVVVDDGGVLATRTFSSAKGGNILIEAPSYLNISGSSPVNPIAVSLITTLSFNSGPAGNIDINTSNLSLLEGGRLSSVTFNTGTGGKVSVKADDVKVIGLEPQAEQDSSTIRSGSLGSGDAGSLVIDTSRLTVAKGGKINTSTGTAGKGGELTINAREFIEVIGSPEKNLPSEITAEAKIGNPRILKILNLPPDFSGDAGSININTPRLSLTNGGKISVLNEGTGDAGTLSINADQLSINNASILATTASGNGGNTLLQSKLLLMKDGTISSSSLGDGLGGNIKINADLFVSFGKSIISANAQNAKGGNITFNTEGFFPSPDTKITATSALGAQADGTVTFNNPDIDLSVAALKVEPEITKPEISSICKPKSADSYSEFIITGEGGLPTGAADPLASTTGWHDPSGRSEQPNDAAVQTPEIVQVDDAQGWVINPDGTMSLVAYANQPTTEATKSSNCNAQTLSPDRLNATHPQPDSPGSGRSLSARPHTPETATARAAPSNPTRTPTPKDSAP